MSQVDETAARRSREAEDATVAAAAEASSRAHLLACELHREAAHWQSRVPALRRAQLHEAYALVHAQAATRLRDE